MDYVVREHPFEEIERKGGLRIAGVYSPYEYFIHVKKFVAERNGEIVGRGVVIASKHNLIGSLLEYSVDPEHRRRGLGSRILHECVNYLERSGLQAMFIDTGPSVAHSVYEKHGFSDVVPGYPEWMGKTFTGKAVQEYLYEYFDVSMERLSVVELDIDWLIEVLLLINSCVVCPFMVKNYLLTLFSDDQMHEGQMLVEIPRLNGILEKKRAITVLGVLSGGRLIGFSTLSPLRLMQWNTKREDHVGLWDFYVHPPLCNMKVVTTLYSEVRRTALEKGFSRLKTAESPSLNVKTKILRELGFEIDYVMKDAVIFTEGGHVRGTYKKVSLEELAYYSTELFIPSEYTHPWRVPWDY